MRKLKIYFIPGAENDHQPVILRRPATLTILGVVLVVELVFLVGTQIVLPRSKLLGLVLPTVLVEETNQSRQADGENTLAVNNKLVAAAQQKANDMATRGYFAHVTPDGLAPWYWLDQAHYSYQAAGENLAVNFLDSRDVVNAWLNSPSHRANLLNGNFTEIGIATASGLFQGRPAIFVVQFFGRPSVAEAASVNRESRPLTAATGLRAPTVASGSLATTTAGTSSVKGAEVTTDQNISWLDRLLVQPGRLIGFIYFALAALVLIALVLNVFIKIRIQYPVLIINGLLLLVLILLLILANQQLLLATAKIF